MKDLKAIVLAAGKGTHMRTEGCDLPKVMRTALGKPLLYYVLSALPVEKKEDAVIIVGYKKETVMEAFSGYTFAVQEEQKGTGHAASCAEGALKDFDGNVIICCGDTPLISAETYDALVKTHVEEENDCTMLSGTSPEPLKGYGRVMHDENGAFLKIVEERDCTPEEAKIQEYNSGVFVFRAKKLFSALKELKTDNAQGEYYLTDAPYIMKARGDKVGVCVRPMGDELIGVNTPEQLSEVERILLSR